MAPGVLCAGKYSWRHPPLVDVFVKDAGGFIPNTLVKIPYDERALFFRVLLVDRAGNRVRLRLERFTLFWQTKSALIKARRWGNLPCGTALHASSSQPR